MLKIRQIGMLIMLCILFVACDKREDVSSSQLQDIYYLDSEMTQLVKEEYEVNHNSTDIAELAKELLKAMKESEDTKNKSAIGKDVEITDVRYKESKLEVYFSATYNGRSGTEEILSRAAIVQTLCGIKGVDYVEFYVEDQPLMLSGATVGLMNDQSFISDLNQNKVQHAKPVTLYFSNKTGDGLKAIQTSVNYESAAPLAKMLMEKLIQGEETIANMKRSGDIIPTIPPDTVLNNLTVRDNICYLDFSKEFNSLMKGIRSDVVVYSIVNTLCELPDINHVQITVEGEPQEKYGEMDGFHLALERKLDLVTS